MKKTALVIMAAGIGSRFGKGIKQLEPVGPNGEIIMDYSIHDALEAGFNKVVFIIRKDLEKDFKEVIGNRISKITEVEYAFQELDDLPAGFAKPEGRTKPWQLAAQLETQVFDTKIRSGVAIAEAPAHGESIFEYSPRASAVKDYGKFLDEVEKIIGFREK